MEKKRKQCEICGLDVGFYQCDLHAHVNAIHCLKLKIYCKLCKIFVYCVPDTEKRSNYFLDHVANHLKSKQDLEEYIGEFSKIREENPIIFANKRSTVMKVDYPISKYLEDLLKDFNNIELNTKINLAYNSMMNMFKKSDKTTGKFIYFRLSKEVLRNEKNDGEEFSFKIFVAAIYKGYFGKTIDRSSRDCSHKSSSDSQLVIYLNCNEHEKLYSFIEYIIIKLLNVNNFSVNTKNGKSFFIEGLSYEDNALIGLKYLIDGFEKCKQIIKEDPTIVDYVSIIYQNHEHPSSQETVYYLTGDTRVTLNEISSIDKSLKITKIDKLENGSRANIRGECIKKDQIRGSGHSSNRLTYFNIILADENGSVIVRFTDLALDLHERINLNDWLEILDSEIEVTRLSVLGNRQCGQKFIVIKDPKKINKIIQPPNDEMNEETVMGENDEVKDDEMNSNKLSENEFIIDENGNKIGYGLDGSFVIEYHSDEDSEKNSEGEAMDLFESSSNEDEAELFPSEEEMNFENNDNKEISDFENIVCKICSSDENEDLLLLCGNLECDAAFHTFCIGLGVDVPEHDWFCSKRCFEKKTD